MKTVYTTTFKSILLFLLISSSLNAQSQLTGKEYNIWHFGLNAGMDFNHNPVVSIGDGKISTYEGSASICDKEGNLLLYSDGVTVYNKNHEIIENGTGLAGHYSSAQSAIFIPKPGFSNVVYLVTISVVGGRGISYSEIDLTLSNGKGGILADKKNISLRRLCYERMTVVHHANLHDFWIIAHQNNSNKYFSFLASGEGISLFQTSELGSTTDCRYMMKASPNGDKIASINAYQHIIQLFDFDNNTGSLSNVIQIPFHPQNTVPLSPTLGYGIEFSHNASFLYAASNKVPGPLYQWDLRSKNLDKIITSQKMISSSRNNAYGALQLGPDRKIYIARQGLPYLGVIEKPYLPGHLCEFDEIGLKLNHGTNSIGLPNFVQSMLNIENGLNYKYHIDMFHSNEILCTGDTLFFKIEVEELEYCNVTVNGKRININRGFWISEAPGDYEFIFVFKSYLALATSAPIIIKKQFVIKGINRKIFPDEKSFCDSMKIEINPVLYPFLRWETPEKFDGYSNSIDTTTFVKLYYEDTAGCARYEQATFVKLNFEKPQMYIDTVCIGWENSISFSTHPKLKFEKSLWVFPNGQSDTSVHSSFYSREIIDDSIRLLITYSAFCEKSYYLPTANTLLPYFEAKIKIDTTCIGMPLHIKSLTEEGLQKWKFSDGSTSLEKEIIWKTPFEKNITGKFIVVSNTVCSDTFEFSLNEAVKQIPVANFVVDTVCRNQLNSVRFEKTEKNNDPEMYFWEINKELFSSFKSDEKIYFEHDSVSKIKLIVMNGSMCSDSIEKTASFLNMIIPEIFVWSDTVCSKHPVTLSFKLSSEPDNFETYFWIYEQDTFFNIPEINPVFLASDSKKVKLVAINKNGCYETTEIESKSVVYPNSEANFVVHPVCVGSPNFIEALRNDTLSEYKNVKWWVNNNEIKEKESFYMNFDFGSTATISLFIEDEQGCKDTIERQLEIPHWTLPSFTLQSDTVCEGLPNNIKLIDNEKNIAVWDWSLSRGVNGSKNVFELFLSTQNQNVLKVYAKCTNGCTKNKSFELNDFVRPIPSSDFSYESIRDSVEYVFVEFKSHSADKRGMAFYWDFGIEGNSNSAIHTIVHRENSPLYVTHTVTDKIGCKSEESKTIIFKVNRQFYIPTAFSPNRDGLNETFKPEGVSYTQQYVFRIYNRWGELLFQTDNRLIGWDGTYRGINSPQETYVYTLAYKNIDGDEVETKGTFVLLR